MNIISKEKITIFWDIRRNQKNYNNFMISSALGNSLVFFSPTETNVYKYIIFHSIRGDRRCGRSRPRGRPLVQICRPVGFFRIPDGCRNGEKKTEPVDRVCRAYSNVLFIYLFKSKVYKLFCFTPVYLRLQTRCVWTKEHDHSI